MTHGAEYKFDMSVTKAIRAAGLMDISHSSQAAMDRGSAIHAALEFYDQDDLDAGGMDERIAPYLDQWIAFKRDSACHIKGVEVQIDNETHRYSGRVDRLVVINNEPGVLDIKTGQPQPWHALQTAAYAEGDYKLARWTLYLRPDGYKLDRHTDRYDWTHFLAALSVARLRVAWGLE